MEIYHNAILVHFHTGDPVLASILGLSYSTVIFSSKRVFANFISNFSLFNCIFYILITYWSVCRTVTCAWLTYGHHPLPKKGAGVATFTFYYVENKYAMHVNKRTAARMTITATQVLPNWTDTFAPRPKKFKYWFTPKKYWRTFSRAPTASVVNRWQKFVACKRLHYIYL